MGDLGRGRKRGRLAARYPLLHPMNRIRTALIVCGLCALISACNRSRREFVPKPPSVGAQTIRIGTYASLTGPDVAIGAAIQRGFDLALELENAKNSVQFELVTYDDQSRPAGAAAAVRRLLQEDHVALIVGGWNSDRAAAAARDANGALVVCPGCAAANELTAAGAIGLAPSVRERAEALAECVVRTMIYSKVAILTRAHTPSDLEAAVAFRAALVARGVQAGEPFAFTPESISAVLTTLAGEAPQAVLIAFDGREAALAGRALRRRAVPSALLFFGAPDMSALPESDRAAALEGALFASAFDALAPSGPEAEFAAGFHARFGLRATETEFVAYAGSRHILNLAARMPGAAAAELERALQSAPGTHKLKILRVENAQFVRIGPPPN